MLSVLEEESTVECDLCIIFYVGVELDKVKRVRELDGDAWLNNGKNGVISLVAKGNVAK